MNYHVVEARYMAGRVVWLRFRDGTTGEIDLVPVLEGPIFEPLRDPLVPKKPRDAEPNVNTNRAPRTTEA